MSEFSVPPSAAGNAPLKLLLVDAHDRSRRSSRVLLDTLPGLRVVGETGDHAEALTLLVQERPDMVIMSMRVRGGSGAATSRALLERQPALPILILTLFDSPEYVDAAFEAGARAYVLKQSTSQDLVAAIDSLMKGHSYMGAGVKHSRVSLEPSGPSASSSVSNPRDRKPV